MADLGLAYRLLRGAGRREIVRLCAMALGVALAVFAVLIGIAAPRVTAQAHQVEADRTPVYAENDSSTGLHLSSTTATLHNRPWTRVEVSAATAASPLPPGLTAWPQVGQSVASPALRDLARQDPSVASMVGDLAPDTIGAVGLTAPDELVSYTVTAAPAGAHAPGRQDAAEPAVIGFGGGSVTGSGLLPVLEVVLLVISPAALFLLSCLRLSAASRARRSFALTLVGMSPRRAARLYGREMTLIAVLGYALGAGAYVVTQGRLGASGLLGIRWWPHQGRIGPVLLVVLGVVAVTAVGVLARRSMTSLAARSRSRRTTRSSRLQAWIALVLGLPSVGYLVATAAIGALRPTTAWASDPHALGILTAVTGAVAAVVLGTPAAVAALSGRLSDAVPATVALGLRGAVHRLPSSQKLIAFIAGSVMLAGLCTAFVATLHRSAFGDPTEASISVAIADLPHGWVQRLPQGAFTAEVSAPGPTAAADVVVGDCAGVERLSAVVFTRPGPCTETVQRGGLTAAAAQPSVTVGGHTLALGDLAPTPDVAWDVKVPLAQAPWLGDVADGTLTYWVSRADSSYRTTLAALTAAFPGVRLDAGMRNPDQYAGYRTQVGTLRAAVALGLLLSVCSFLMAALESRWERARSVTTLAALGASRRDLRLANLVEFTFPILVAALPAAVVGALGGWAVVSLNGTRGMFTVDVVTAVAGGTAVGVVVAAAVGWLSGGATFRREALADT
ncbi:FtsX-like permease family protein [Nocardioides sp.]|uniref:FtsX-like permease family protein n=1 Tax=Nocardioides sp. TaxID=35761 RepID=UPI00262466A1|nr:FtsX-like permease family protein [Nocardioides sp.]